MTTRFTKIGPNAVKHSDGFQVSIVKRSELIYEDSEGPRSIPVEPMADGVIVVSASILGSDDAALIKQRLGESLNFLGIRHRFD